MTQQTPGREAQLTEWKRLTEEVLPALARRHRWPLRLDHCFKRICLDHAFADVWYNHVHKPAERHMEGDALERALQCARDIVDCGEGVLRERNAQSLRYRAKAEFAPPKRRGAL